MVFTRRSSIVLSGESDTHPKDDVQFINNISAQIGETGKRNSWTEISRSDHFCEETFIIISHFFCFFLAFNDNFILKLKSSTLVSQGRWPSFWAFCYSLSVTFSVKHLFFSDKACMQSRLTCSCSRWISPTRFGWITNNISHHMN